MKRCNHPNVVRLYEVMDDPSANKIYLVLEYVNGGELVWKEEADGIEKEKGRPALALEDARRYFLDVVLGLEYCRCRGESWCVCVILITHTITQYTTRALSIVISSPKTYSSAKTLATLKSVTLAYPISQQSPPPRISHPGLQAHILPPPPPLGAWRTPNSN